MSGITRLRWWAQEGHAEAVKALLNAGADRNLRNKKRETAIDIAAASGHAEIAPLLNASSPRIAAGLLFGRLARVAEPVEKLVALANRLGVPLRQSYPRVGKIARIKHQRYAQVPRVHEMVGATARLPTCCAAKVGGIGPCVTSSVCIPATAREAQASNTMRELC
jgi:ankyrin repeat protein